MIRPCRSIAVLSVYAGLAVGVVLASDPDTGRRPAAASYAIVNGERVDVPAIPMGDAATIERIIDEGKNRSQVMATLTHLCAEIGPRLTGSSKAEQANRWAMQRFESWGLTNAHLHQWGEIPVRFDRGPSSARLVRPGSGEEPWVTIKELDFTTLAWAAGTKGEVVGPVHRLPANADEANARAESLRGAWILIPSRPDQRQGVRGPTGSTSDRLRFLAELREEMQGSAQATPPAAAAEPAQRNRPDRSARAVGARVVSGSPTPATYTGTWTGTVTGPDIPQGATFRLELTVDDAGKASGSLAYPGWHTAAMENGTIDIATGQLSFEFKPPQGEVLRPRFSLINGVLTSRDSVGGAEPIVHLGRKEGTPDVVTTASGRRDRFGSDDETPRARPGNRPEVAAAGAPERDVYRGTFAGPMTGGEKTPFELRISILAGADITGELDFGDGSFVAPIKSGKFYKESSEIEFTWATPMGEATSRWSIKDGKLRGSNPDPAGGNQPYVYEGTLVRTGEAPPPQTARGPAEAPAQPQRAGAQAQAATPGADEERALFRALLQAGVAGFVASSGDERVWTSSAAGWRNMRFDNLPQDVSLIVSEPHFDAINSKLADNWPVHLAVNADNRFVEGPIPVYNTIAEIRGTEKPDEVVIVSAHLDSWNGPGSVGTVDNGTGSAVTIEAARILMASGAKPKRTIRFALWTGEEQGLLGSMAYVAEYRDELRRTTIACFVDDGGTNFQGGLQGIPAMRDYLAAATAPVNGRFFSTTDRDRLLSDGDPSNDLNAGNLDVNVRITDRMPRGGASDHASFNRAGIPGFYWDEVGRANYRHGWHTQYDRLDQAIEEYLIQSATCSAITAYNLACAPDRLAREPEPAAEPGQPQRGQE